MPRRFQILELLLRVAAWLMNLVSVNQTKRGMRNGVPVFIKQRRAGSSIVIWFGNRFLALARSGVRMFVRADEWIEWEAYCSRLLYPERPWASSGPGKTISITEVHGTSLRQLMNRNETDLKPFVAAARELRRVHQIQCCHFKAAWSHGDLHLGNILYDRVTGRAILIDFDTRHEFGIDKIRRHSDDLKVFLLELVAREDAVWLERATAFVEEYGDSAVLQELDRGLAVPCGLARILWYTRTQCASIHRTEQRLQRLRQILCQKTAVGGS